MSDFNFDIDLDNEALQYYEENLEGVFCDIHKELPRYEICTGTVVLTTCCKEFRHKIDAILDDNISN